MPRPRDWLRRVPCVPRRSLGLYLPSTVWGVEIACCSLWNGHRGRHRWPSGRGPWSPVLLPEPGCLSEVRRPGGLGGGGALWPALTHPVLAALSAVEVGYSASRSHKKCKGVRRACPHRRRFGSEGACACLRSSIQNAPASPASLVQPASASQVTPRSTWSSQSLADGPQLRAGASGPAGASVRPGLSCGDWRTAGSGQRVVGILACPGSELWALSALVLVPSGVCGVRPSPAPYWEGFPCEPGLAGPPPEVAAGGPGRSPTVKVLAASLMSGLSGRGVLILERGSSRPPWALGAVGTCARPGSVCDAAGATTWPSCGLRSRQLGQYVTRVPRLSASRHMSVPRTRL